jgi:hypothetical protein
VQDALQHEEERPRRLAVVHQHRAGIELDDAADVEELRDEVLVDP